MGAGHSIDLAEGIMNGFINLACIISGPILVIFMSKGLKLQ